MPVMGDSQPASSATQLDRNSIHSPNGDTNEDTDYSIVSIPSPSPTSMMNVSAADQFNFGSLRNVQMSLANCVNDLTVDQLQEKLKELVIQNHRLTDTLRLTNATIREQYDTLVRWQASIVQNNQETHRKFTDLKTIIRTLESNIEKLQQETREKSGRMEKAEAAVHDLEATIQKLSDDNERLELENQAIQIQNADLQTEREQIERAFEKMKSGMSMASMEKQRLRQDAQDLEAQLSDLRLQIENHQTQTFVPPPSVMAVSGGFSMLPRAKEDVEIQTSYDSKKKEDSIPYKEINQELQEKVSALTQELNFQNMKVEVLQNTNVKQQENCATLADQLRKTQNEMAELENQLLQVQQQQQQAGSPQDFVQVPPSQIVHQLMTSQRRFQEATTDVSRYQQERYDSISNCLSEYSSRLGRLTFDQQDSGAIEMLRGEIGKLQALLMTEQEKGMEERRKFNELSQQFNHLLNDYQDVMHLYEEQVHAGDQNKIHQDIKQRNFQEKLDEITANLMSKDMVLDEAAKEIADLKKEVDSLKQEVETHKIQAEVYQKDFVMERESRENLVTQKLQLEEEVNSLRGLNQYMQDELQTYQHGQFNQMHGSHAQTSPFLDRRPHRRHSRRLSREGAPSEPPSEPYNPSYNPAVSAAAAAESARLNQWMGGRTAIPAADTNMFMCPKCQLGFNDVQPLENHVESCLNNPDPFRL